MIPLTVLFHFGFSFLFVSTLKLQDELNRGCEQPISAVSDSPEQDGTLHLFVGSRIFVFDPLKKALEDVLRVKDIYSNLSTPVTTACFAFRNESHKNRLRWFTMATKGRHMWVFTSNDSKDPLEWTYDDDISELESNQLKLDVIDKRTFDCMACVCYKDESCFYWRIFNQKESIGTRVMTIHVPNYMKGTEKESRYQEEIPMPRYMSADVLPELEEDCIGMAVDVDEDNKKAHLTYLDKNGLHYFTNGKENHYVIKQTEIFSCTSFFSVKNPVLYLVVVPVILVLIAIPATFLTIFLLARKQNRSFLDENTTGTVATKVDPSKL